MDSHGLRRGSLRALDQPRRLFKQEAGRITSVVLVVKIMGYGGTTVISTVGPFAVKRIVMMTFTVFRLSLAAQC